MSLICVGHSHLGAVSKGAALVGKSIIQFRLREMKKSDGLSQSELQKQVGKMIAEAVRESGAKQVFCFCGGGAPATLGLVQHPERFDFVMPDRIDLPVDERAHIIPFDAVRILMATVMRRHWRMLRHLSKAVPVKLVQAETPPPVADEAFLEKAALAYDPGVKTYGISSRHLRYKLWRLHSQLFREFCAKSNITFAPNPPEVFDADGFLAEPYWGDYVHGNARYGAAVLARLEALSQ